MMSFLKLLSLRMIPFSCFCGMFAIAFTACTVPTNNNLMTNHEGLPIIFKDTILEREPVYNSVDSTELVFVRSYLPINTNQLKKFNWKKWEKRVKSSIKLNHLNKIKNTEFFEVPNFNSKYDYEEYHLIDFSGDGKLDVVFAGRNPSGLESNNMAFFLNIDDTSMILVAKLSGSIIKMAQPNINQPILVQIATYPCCSNVVSTIKNIAFSTKGNCYFPFYRDDPHFKNGYGQFSHPDFCVRIIERYAFVQGTFFPEITQPSDTLQTVEDKPIFYQPIGHKYDFDHRPLSMNIKHQLSNIPAKTSVQVVSEMTTSNGKYYFVQVLKIGEGFINTDVVSEGLYAWISADGLQK